MIAFTRRHFHIAVIRKCLALVFPLPVVRSEFNSLIFSSLIWPVNLQHDDDGTLLSPAKKHCYTHCHVSAKKLLGMCGYRTVMRCQNETKSDVNYHFCHRAEVGEWSELSSSWKCRESVKWKSLVCNVSVVANHLHYNDKVPSDLSHWNAHLCWPARKRLRAARPPSREQTHAQAAQENDNTQLLWLLVRLKICT